MPKWIHVGVPSNCCDFSVRKFQWALIVVHCHPCYNIGLICDFNDVQVSFVFLSLFVIPDISRGASLFFVDAVDAIAVAAMWESIDHFIDLVFIHQTHWKRARNTQSWQTFTFAFPCSAFLDQSIANAYGKNVYGSLIFGACLVMSYYTMDFMNRKISSQKRIQILCRSSN